MDNSLAIAFILHITDRYVPFLTSLQCTELMTEYLLTFLF